MKKNLLIASSNIRKAKGQTVTIIVLGLIAALLFNMWLMLAMDYTKNFERIHARQNAQHVTIAADNDSAEFAAHVDELLSADAAVTQYSVTDIMLTLGKIDFNGGEVYTDFVISQKAVAVSRPVGRVEILYDSENASGVYLPIMYKSRDIAVGKTVNLVIGGNNVSYTVCGFFNSVMAGSHNCALCEIVLTEDKYAELKALGYAPMGVYATVRINNIGNSQEREAALNSAITRQYPDVRIASNSYELVVQSRYIAQSICCSVISVTAFLVLLIAIVVICSGIANYIREYMQNLGALKAIGYTSRQLVAALLLQFVSVTTAAAVVGVALSYCLFPAINSMMMAQTGIPYAIRFLPLPMLITLLILCGSTAIAVLLSTLKIRKIEPITALRSGVSTHSFKRNRIPLEKTKAPLNTALALKTTLSGVKQNITVFVTMFVLSLVVVFTGLIVRNVITDMTPFVNLIVGEMSDGSVDVQTTAEDELLAVLDKDERVENYFLYTSRRVTHVGGIELSATVSDDFSKQGNQDMVYSGRFPKFANEIVVSGKYAKEQGLKIGQQINIAVNGKQGEFLISGFSQGTNNLGKDCFLTRSGYESLGVLDNVSYYYNAKAGTDIDALNAEIKELIGADVNFIINSYAAILGTGKIYVALMTMIVIAVIILSLIIITFVLYLLVKTLLGSKKREYGILKAIGFTSRQLAVQTALSFMPAIILSTVIGLTVGGFVINPIMTLALSGMGIAKCTFIVPVGFNVAAGFGLVALSFGIACLLSLRVKKIAPRELLVNE